MHEGGGGELHKIKREGWLKYPMKVLMVEQERAQAKKLKIRRVFSKGLCSVK